MTRQELFEINIEAVSPKSYQKAKERWDHIAKPIDGLGDFEDLICQIAAIQGKEVPDIENRSLIVFCSDNGISNRGVTQSSQVVTRLVAEALGEDKSSASCLAKSVNAKVIPVDIGINWNKEIKGILPLKVSNGTKDFINEPAMSEEEVLKAISTGIELVKIQKEAGDTLILTGEMGIGNTTTSTAVLCALLKLKSDDIVGRGAGLDDEKLSCKRRVVKEGIVKYKDIFDNSSSDKDRAFEILKCLGGLDIAAMCGLFIGGAMEGIPVVIDGVISSVAALLAESFLTGSRDYMIASHSGREGGTAVALNKLGKKAYINGNMALGEGTGALMLLPLIDSAHFFYKNANRFDQNGIEDYERFNK